MTAGAQVLRPAHLPGVELFRAEFHRHSFPRHWHETLNFGVVEWGLNTYWHRGGDKHAGPGTVNLMNPDEIHDGRGGESGWGQRMFHVDAACVREVTGGPFPYFPDTVLEDRSLADLVLRAHRSLEVGTEPLEGESLFLEALGTLIRRHAADGRAARKLRPDPPRVARMRALLHEKLAEPVTLDEVAAAAGVSRFHALRLFKEAVGLPPHAYLKHCRVSHAAALLRRGQSPSLVAQATGFADQSHLTRAFKAVYGVTPGRFQQ